VFKYISPTTALEIPEFGKIVAVELVPVILVPVYHLLDAPVAPLILTLVPAKTVVVETDVIVYL
jgi:hypothetical protein